MISSARLSTWLGWMVLAIFIIPVAGPLLDGLLLPVRVDQRIERVVRTAETLCWHWISLKKQNRVSTNIDAFAVYQPPGEASPEREVVAPYNEVTRRGWTRGSALPANGKPSDQPWCIKLPAYVTPEMPIRVEQTATYPGVLGMFWHVTLRLPDIVDPPGVQVP